MDINGPLCCNDDQVFMMTTNFASIDAVFGKDCPLCAVNMKKMWCMYTCATNKVDFVAATGYVPADIPGDNYTTTQFTVNPDMACTLFTSCKKTSFIS